MTPPKRSFAPPRKSKSNVIDDSAVPDPDVILLADAVLARRPVGRSPPTTPRKDGEPPDPVAADSRGVTKLLRIGRSSVRPTPTADSSSSADHSRDASLDGDDLVLKNYVHIGFAADTPNGLVVPVIRDVDQKSLSQLALETAALAAKAASSVRSSAR